MDRPWNIHNSQARGRRGCYTICSPDAHNLFWETVPCAKSDWRYFSHQARTREAKVHDNEEVKYFGSSWDDRSTKGLDEHFKDSKETKHLPLMQTPSQIDHNFKPDATPACSRSARPVNHRKWLFYTGVCPRVRQRCNQRHHKSSQGHRNEVIEDQADRLKGWNHSAFRQAEALTGCVKLTFKCSQVPKTRLDSSELVVHPRRPKDVCEGVCARRWGRYQQSCIAKALRWVERPSWYFESGQREHK